MNDQHGRNLYRFPGCDSMRLETVEQLVAAMLVGDAAVINFCIYEARLRGLIVPLFQKLASESRPAPDVRIAFQSAWITQGLWIRDNLTADDALLDLLANLLPGYAGTPVRLYRGERWSNHENRRYGASWSSQRAVGEMYARGLNCCPMTGGVLLQTIAQADAILAAPIPELHMGWEAEYVVDRRKLGQVEVIQRY